MNLLPNVREMSQLINTAAESEEPLEQTLEEQLEGETLGHRIRSECR